MREKLNRHFWLMFFICILGTPQFLTANSIKFISADFQTVSKKSLKENKYFFANYSAAWCAACEIMMESANSNPDLVNYIDKNFIAVKVNVDNQIGKKWQSEFEVKYLPTLIIFSPDGKEIARSSGGISSTNFLTFLQKIEDLNSEVATSSNPKTELGEIEKPGLKFSSKSDVEKFGKEETAVFRIQVGLYSELKNANRKIEKMKSKTAHPVFFRQEKVKNKLYYQVVIGDPFIEKDAFQVQKELAAKGVKSYILKY